MIKIATVGTSAITSAFISALKNTKRFDISAVYSRNFDTGRDFADRHGVKDVFTSLEKMAKCEDLDAVYIASPNSFHYSQAKLFLECGKHVICEKPIVTSHSEFHELYSLASDKNLIYMEAMMSLYTPARARIKEALLKIGKIKTARIDFSKRSSRWDAYAHGRCENVFNPELFGGALNDLGVYCVYTAIDIFGTPHNICASKVMGYNGIDISGSAKFRYGEFDVDLTYAKNEDSNSESLIIGEHGEISISSVSKYHNVILKTADLQTLIFDSESREKVMSYEAAAFADFIENVQTRERYKENSILTESVIKAMQKIRNSAG